MKKTTSIAMIIIIICVTTGFNFKKDEKICKNLSQQYIGNYINSYATGEYIELDFVEDNDNTYLYKALGQINGERVKIFNTKFKDYKYATSYKEVKNIEKDKILVDAIVNIDYSYDKNSTITSGIYNIDYKFIFRKIEGTWKIVSIESSYDEFQHFKDKVEKLKETSRGNIKDIIDNCKKEELENLNRLSKLSLEKNLAMSRGEKKYILGIEYAEKFALAPKDKRIFYTAGDSDCTNFVSQCIWASLGGYDPRDMDTTISNIKKQEFMVTGVWYGSQYGGSMPWENVTSLWDFITNNNKTGPKAKGYNNDKPYYNLSMDTIALGDVIQVKKDGDLRYSHSAYVTAITYEKGVKQIYISQHSYDKLNRSLEDLIFSWGGNECYIRLLKLQ